MQINILYFLSVLSFLAAPLFGKTVHPREKPVPLKISVIIPCAGQHIQHLSPLLTLLGQQTCLPDEVVISLSSVETLMESKVDEIEKGSWPFSVKLLRFRGAQSAGLNRNIAASHVSGDVMICQDADDLPHPQRIEIVKYLFEHYEIDHLIHNFVFDGTIPPLYEKESTPLYSFDDYDAISSLSIFHDHIHNGNICCTVHVARALPWDDVRTLECDHDVQFNRNVYRRFKNTAVIPLELITYRPELSAYLIHRFKR